MVVCTLLRGVTGFKLVFQSKCLRMDVAACVVHVFNTVSSAKRESCFKDQVFVWNEKRLLKPELLFATAVATTNFTSILSNQ